MQILCGRRCSRVVDLKHEGALTLRHRLCKFQVIGNGDNAFLCFTLKERISIPQGSDSELQIEQLFEKTLQILVQYKFIILL